MKYFVISSMCHYNKSVLYTVRHIRNDFTSPTLNSCFWGEYPYEVCIGRIIAATRFIFIEKVRCIYRCAVNFARNYEFINNITEHQS